MPSEELRRKLLIRKEKMQVESLPDRLTGIEIIEFVERDTFPHFVHEAFREFTRTSTAPDTRIHCNASSDQTRNWYTRLIEGAGIHQLFYRRPGMKLFPWMHCRRLI